MKMNQKRNICPVNEQKPLILITERLDEQCAAWLAEHGRVVWPGRDGQPPMEQLLPEADALVVRTYTQIDAKLLDAAPRLRVIGRAGAGLDNFDLDACRQRGVIVVHTPDANTQAVVEYVLGLMLDDVRPRTHMTGITDSDDFHALRKQHVGLQLDQLTLGIVGFGRIGTRLGRAAHALGMKLLVNDLIDEDALRAAAVFPFDCVAKSDLYADSDIITVHVDGRGENRHLIDRKALDAMKPGVLLINTSRGMVVDADALADWAKARAASEAEAARKSRAVLDVHDPEPPTASYPLWRVPNVKLLPHLASRTDTALANMSWVVRDVAAVLRGETPKHPAW